jgi:hypothetical protein
MAPGGRRGWYSAGGDGDELIDDVGQLAALAQHSALTKRRGAFRQYLGSEIDDLVKIAARFEAEAQGDAQARLPPGGPGAPPGQ